jgi:hypothetical protein
MFVGHLAVGLAGKRMEPRISLGTWMLAALLADLLFFAFLIGGVEHVGVAPGVTVNRFVGDIQYSHSLLMDAIWGGLFAAAYRLRRLYARGTWLLFGAVLSHWTLDFISHRPDMKLAPGSRAAFGLELWNSTPATLVLEGGAWLLAIALYVFVTTARTRTGVYAFWAGVALLTLAWYGNISGGIDPNPVRAGISGLIFLSLTVAWAYWMNRARAISERPQ